MPLYEYECDSCGASFEVIQRFTDPPVRECRTCGGPVHKILSAPAIQFKGSGWYVTDYARKGTPEPGGTTKDGAAASSDSNKDGADAKKDAGAKTPTESAPAAKGD